MRLYPEKLAADLERRLHPVYLISGDETLLVQECADQVRAAARREGCSERVVIDAGDRSFHWRELLDGAGNMSLFGERRLLELRLPSGKPGKEGSEALLAYLEQAADDVLLIVAGKIDRASSNSKWYKAIDGAGVTMQIWPVSGDELPQWLARRAASRGLRIDSEALGLLAERVEGNLLAAAQELEKLALISEGEAINTQAVGAAVANSARFSLFNMIDVALAGRDRDSLRMLHGLRAEGSQPAALLWAIVRELELLRGLAVAVEQGRPPSRAMAEARVWQSRQAAIGAALDRHGSDSCTQLLDLAADLDASIKGFGRGNPWEIMELLMLGIARRGIVSLPV
ncbi:MAG: DNA polymerase III subunit delta [Halieaceae bacterium]|nr:DNA polymerase III subunit delta [Halieaceae bacterium]